MPPKLDEIIHKALEKDHEPRYQAASDIRTDLKRFRRETESGRISSTSSSGRAVQRGICNGAGQQFISNKNRKHDHQRQRRHQHRRQVNPPRKAPAKTLFISPP